MLIVIPLAQLGCGDDVDNSDDLASTTSALTSCSPNAGFDDCIEVDLTQLEYWQQAPSDPDWRDVITSDDPDIDYQVIIDVEELNGGIIPTQKGQGVYSDYDHFFQTKSQLLGVDVENDTYQLIVIGTSAKVDGNNHPVNASGVFLYDALSTANGAIMIDGQNIARDYYSTARFHNVDHQVNSQQQTDGTQDPSYFELSDSDLMSTHPWADILHDEEILSSGGWNAKLQMFRRDTTLGPPDLVIPGRLVLQASNIVRLWNREHLRCLYIWDLAEPEPTVARHCPTADFLDVTLEVAEPDHEVMELFSSATNATAVTIYSALWGPGDASGPEPVWNQKDACGYGLILFDSIGPDVDFGTVFTDEGAPQDCPYLF